MRDWVLRFNAHGPAGGPQCSWTPRKLAAHDPTIEARVLRGWHCRSWDHKGESLGTTIVNTLVRQFSAELHTNLALGAGTQVIVRVPFTAKSSSLAEK